MAKQIYFRGEAGPGNVNLPSMPNVASVPRVNSQLADIAKGVAETAKAWGQAYFKYDDDRQKGLVDDGYLKARSEMMRWQTEYNRTHQGADALSAQADYESQWDKIAQGINEQYGEKLSGKHAHLLKRSMELGRLYALHDGNAWQTKQQDAWDKNKTLLLQANVEDAIDSGDLARAHMERQRLVDHLGRAMAGLSIEPALKKLDEQFAERHATNLIAQGKFDEAERLLYNGGGSTQTGRYRVLAKHESGTQGSQHVSYGLPVTDGIDVGKFSFITKGGNGGSVGDFIRWAGTQGGTGKKLYDAMHEVVGGDWNKLDSKELWKTKAADIWREAAKSDPKAFEELEDRFMDGRIDKEIAKLRPEVQEAIANDKTGALYEMAASTINQHATALKILNNNFNSDPETFIRQVYKDRSNPARFARTHDPNMGKRRMDEEVQDVLSIYRGGSNQKREPMFVAYDNPQGLIEKGNIDLASRPKVKNSDGSISTVRSSSFGIEGKEVLLPTVSEDGRILSEDEALENYKKTGKHLGKFDSVENANAYAQKLHEQQEQMYVKGKQSSKQNAQSVSGASSQGRASGFSPLVSPAKAVAFQRAIDAGRLKQRQGMVLNDFATNPQEGIKFLSTSEGQARYGMDGKEADETLNLLHTRFIHMKQMEKQKREHHEQEVFTNAVNAALGIDGKDPDPISAYRLIAEDPNLDGKSKLDALKAIREGTLDQDSPEYVIDVKNRIANKEPVTDSELAKAMASGKLSNKTKNDLLKMRELANGPRGEIVKSAFKALDDAYRKSMMADGTPEQAQAHYEAIHELQMVIEEAKEKGTLVDILNPNSKNYVLPSIMSRHQLSMQQQVRAMVNQITGNSNVLKRNGPKETIDEYIKRVNGAAK